MVGRKPRRMGMQTGLAQLPNAPRFSPYHYARCGRVEVRKLCPSSDVQPPSYPVKTWSISANSGLEKSR
jgi:hypothetical protein